MQDAIFIYKKGSKFKVLSLDRPVGKEKELVDDGWKHIETISASMWLQRLLNMSRDHRLKAIGDIVNKGEGG